MQGVVGQSAAVRTVASGLGRIIHMVRVMRDGGSDWKDRSWKRGGKGAESQSTPPHDDIARSGGKGKGMERRKGQSSGQARFE